MTGRWLPLTRVIALSADTDVIWLGYTMPDGWGGCRRVYCALDPYAPPPLAPDGQHPIRVGRDGWHP